MKFFAVLFMIIGFLRVQAVAQEQDSLRIKSPRSPNSGMEFPKLRMDQDMKAAPVFF